MQQDSEYTPLLSESTVFARIVDHIPGGLIVLDMSDHIRYVNKSAEQRLGYSRSELFGAAIEVIFLEAEPGKNWTDIRQGIMDRQVVDSSANLLTANKDEINCTLRAYCISNDQNRPEEIVLVFRDITAEQKIAREVERKNVEMAKMNSELIRSNEELKRVSELKTNFLSIASHELKTPLTSIKGYSEIIIENMKEKVDPGVYRMIESISRAADRLHKVINNMLDVTRIEQKRLRLKPETMDLREIARDSIEELTQFSAERDVQIDCEFAEDLPPFYGDKMRMLQVFTNLLSNALKYSPDHAKIELKIYPEDKQHVRISVVDHGIGIDRNEQEKIFDPFYEVGSAYHHSSYSGRFMAGGTGLGLSIVKGIIERHGGRIWAKSEGVIPGTFPGSTFHVTMPLNPSILWDDDETRVINLAEVNSERDVEEEGVQIEERPTILLIEDDNEAVEVTRMVLEKAFDIIVAQDGESGLRLAFTERPSLILLDLYLPGLDGCRICRLLRSQEETRDIPIAFFSAGTQNEEIQRCFASGADDFIVKPFGGRELVDKVWRLLMKKKTKSAGRGR
jgi:PAS domain S-box-containing protein